MSEVTDGTLPVKIRIPRLPGADEAEAADVAGEIALLTPPEALEEEKTSDASSFPEVEATPFNTPLAPDLLGDPGNVSPLFAGSLLAEIPHPARVEKMRMVVISGHPREGSFCEGLAEAYVDAALAHGHQVQQIPLRELAFDLHETGQPLEPCLLEAQQEILESDHLVFVFPVWWGSMPALLKGFLDRIFRPGFAFKEREEGNGWDGLLGGRTADILITMDTPPRIFRYLLGAPAIRALRDATLAFCGIKPSRIVLLGPVHRSTPAGRSRWLDLAAQCGREAQAWHRTGWRPHTRAWLNIARLQFYIFPALVVLLGALTAANMQAAPFHLAPFLLALLAVVVLEFITVLTNEWHDLPTDSRNQHFGPFTGGSRVLVEGRLGIRPLLRGRNIGLAVLLAATGTLLFTGPAQAGSQALLLGLGLVLGIGYSAPPLRLASRGLGELTVAFTHSFLVLLIGYASQAGSMSNLLPWALALPMFAAVLPSILLAGLPDLEADAEVGKNTLAVRWGRRRLTKVALAVTVASALLHVALVPFSGWLLTLPLLLHAGWLSRGLLDYLARPHPGRIDGLLVRALTYMLWFVLGPLAG